MAEKGFKRKLAAITVAKCYSRLAYDSDEPLLHNLTNFLIIFLTAKDSEVGISEGMTLGTDAYIAKPFSNK